MASLNRHPDHSVKTHEGAPAVANLTPEQILRRSVMACLLWESSFYEDGQSIADRIVENARKVDPHYLAELAKEVRHRANLRHAPLLLLDVLSEPKKHGRSVVSSGYHRIMSSRVQMNFLNSWRSTGVMGVSLFRTRFVLDWERLSESSPSIALPNTTATARSSFAT